MTKTEKTLIDLCELVDAYFQMQQTVVRSAIESQLKEQTKTIVEEIKVKSVRKVKEATGSFIDELAETEQLTSDRDFKVGDWVRCIDGVNRQITKVKKDTVHFEGNDFAPKDRVLKIRELSLKEKV